MKMNSMKWSTLRISTKLLTIFLVICINFRFNYSFVQQPRSRNQHNNLRLSRSIITLSSTNTGASKPKKIPSPIAFDKPAESSLRSSSTSLLKNCVGAGVFSIHSRVGNLPMPRVIALVYFMATWATYNFYLIGETCRLTNTTSYSEAWAKTVSRNSKWIVQTVVVIAPIVSCLANTIVLVDILKLLFQSIGFPIAFYGNRNLLIGLLSSIILYPLCVQKNLSALKSVSIFGILGHLTAMSALLVRLLDKSYAVGGKFYGSTAVVKASLKAAAAASVTATSSKMNLAVVAPAVATTTITAISPLAKFSMLASLLSYCLVTHYNAPRYYAELRQKEMHPLRFGFMALLSYMLAASIYLGTVVLTTKLFGQHGKPPIFALNGFSPADGLGTVARIAFGTSVLASFPLIFLSMRNWFVSQAEVKFPSWADSNNHLNEKMTAALLFLISVLATKCTDIGLVGSIAGGMLGSSMMFVFPPIMYMRAKILEAKKNHHHADGSGGSGKWPYGTLIINSVLLILGASLGAYGTANSVLSSLRK